jgi:hypothetical protein
MLIVTTNYDPLIEMAFDSAGAPYEVVATAADQLAYREGDELDPVGSAHAGMIYRRQNGAAEFEPVLPAALEPNLEHRSIMYKVHGSVPCGSRWPGGYLIAEEDYARFLGRMDRDHIYPYKIKNILRKREILPNGRRGLANSLLFLGYSLQDWNLRVLMDELGIGQGAAGEERHYAVLNSKDEVSEELLKKRNISVRHTDLQTFVDELGIALAAQLDLTAGGQRAA